MRLTTSEDIHRARQTIDAVISATHARRAHSLSQLTGTELWIKPEYLQRTGSFKFRGAYHHLSKLAPNSHVLAASAGNHAQGVALAAQLLGHRATIYMPELASLPKVQATRDYGAEVRLGGATVDDCIELAKASIDGPSSVFVPPFDHPDIIAGQATIGLELLEEVHQLANVLVAIGGGGLCSGIAAAIKHHSPHIKVIGVVAEGANSIQPSLAAGSPTPVEPTTIADGIALRSPSALTLSHVAAFVDEIAVVPDRVTTEAMLMLAERTKAMVEPSGAITLGALMQGGLNITGPTAAVVGGGNVDPLLFSKLINHGCSTLGRFLRLRVVVDDRPGSLARLTSSLAVRHLNVLEVVHQRFGIGLELNTVAIDVVVETLNADHQELVVRELQGEGFEVQRIDQVNQ